MFPDDDDVMAETCRKDRNDAVVCTVCAHTGSVRKIHLGQVSWPRWRDVDQYRRL